MKSGDKIGDNRAGQNQCMQALRASAYYDCVKLEETKHLFENARQLYATEAEEYFFYFIGAYEKKTPGLRYDAFLASCNRQ